MKAKARKSCPSCRRLQALLDAQEARLKALETTVVRLQEKLAAARKDSSTSSKPPSSDIVKPPKPERNLAGSLPPGCANGTKAADGQLPMERLESPRHWNFRPGARQIDIVNTAAAIAVEVAMLVHVRAEAHGAAVQVHLLGQSGGHQGVEAVINRRHRNVRHPIFGSHEDLFRGRMIPSGQQHVINVLPLCREPKAPRRQSFGKPALELEVFVFHH